MKQRWRLFGNNFLFLFLRKKANLVYLVYLVYLVIFTAYLSQSSEILLVCAHEH